MVATSQRKSGVRGSRDRSQSPRIKRRARGLDPRTWASCFASYFLRQCKPLHASS